MFFPASVELYPVQLQLCCIGSSVDPETAVYVMLRTEDLEFQLDTIEKQMAY